MTDEETIIVNKLQNIDCPNITARGSDVPCLECIAKWILTNVECCKNCSGGVISVSGHYPYEKDCKICKGKGVVLKK